MEQQFLSDLLGWISFILLILLVAIQPLGKLEKKYPKVKKVNRILKKYHKLMGIIILVTACIHGKTIVNKTGLATGIISFLLMVVILFTYPTKRLLKKSWVVMHRVLSTIVMAIVIVHILIAIL